MLDEALALATRAHATQTRRDGRPYIEHPRAVAALMRALGPIVGVPVDDRIEAIALLHDVLEDSDTTHDELATRFGVDVADGVRFLTKVGRGHEASVAYWAALCDDAPRAVRFVKACDRLHNLSELHLAPDAPRAARYVDESIVSVLPLVRDLPGLDAALSDAMRVACRNQHVALPPSIVAPPRHVPQGLYAIVQPRGDDEDLRARFTAMLHGGAAIVQLRAKDRSDREVLRLLSMLTPIARAHGVPLVVNDRADLCVAAGAHGVHVGLDDLPAPAVRRVVGADALVGTSTHTHDELDAACTAGGADHVAVGPVFASTTKSGHADVVGLPALRRLVQASTLPVVAIGGVTTTERVADVARCGASLCAVISALEVDDVRATTRLFGTVFITARAAAGFPT